MKWAVPGLEAALGQPGIMAPRGAIGPRIGDSYSSRIIHGVVKGGKPLAPPSTPGTKAIFDAWRSLRTPLRNPMLPSRSTSSARSLRSVPLSSPRIDIDRVRGLTPTLRPRRLDFVGPSTFDVVKSRVAALARSGARTATSAGARALAALGPIGIAIGVALVAAAAIGAVAYYYINNRGNRDIPTVVEETLDQTLPSTPDPPSVKQPDPETLDLWSGNVPWVRRPGVDLSLPQILEINPIFSHLSRSA